MKAMVINNGGVDTSDATATPDDLVLNKTAYVDDELIVGTLQEIDEVVVDEDEITWTGENIPVINYPGTAEPGDVLLGKTAWVNDEVITGEIPDKSIVDSSIGGLNSNYPDLAVHIGFGPQFNTTTISNQRLITIAPPKGYYDGNTWVGIPGQVKTVTPTKANQTIYPDSGKALENVVVNAIPDEYIATSDATATAAHLLKGDTAYVKGNKITGTMISQSHGTSTHNWWFDGTTYDVYAYIPTGAYITEASSGNQMITVGHSETKTVTPTKSTQTISGFVDTSNNTTSGKKFLRYVTVNPIPSNYITTSDANAVAWQVLSGSTAYVNGSKITGTMPNRQITDSTIGGISTSYPTIAIHKGSNPQFNTTVTSKERLFGIAPPEGYYNGNAYVGCPVQNKTVTPTTSSQVVYPDGGKMLEAVTVNPIPSGYLYNTWLPNAGTKIAGPYSSFNAPTSITIPESVIPSSVRSKVLYIGLYESTTNNGLNYQYCNSVFVRNDKKTPNLPSIGVFGGSLYSVRVSQDVSTITLTSLDGYSSDFMEIVSNLNIYLFVYVTMV